MYIVQALAFFTTATMGRHLAREPHGIATFSEAGEGESLPASGSPLHRWRTSVAFPGARWDDIVGQASQHLPALAWAMTPMKHGRLTDLIPPYY